MIEPLLGLPVGRPKGSPDRPPEDRAEAEREHSRRYRRRYPTRSQAGHRASSANKRAAVLGTPGRITTADVLGVWEREPACQHCGSGRGLDHIVAFIDGGPNEAANLQNLCHDCNSRKGALRSGKFVRQSHCKRGHELSPENTYPSGAGRRCRPCELDRQLARRRARGIGPTRREVCKVGHPRTPADTYFRANGWRQCAICARAAMAARKAQLAP